MPDRVFFDALFASIDAQDARRFAGFLTEDAVFRFGSTPPVHGRDAIRAGVDGFFASIKGLRHRLDRIWQDSDAAACHGEVTYTRHDGSVVTLPFADVFVFRGEQVAQYLIYMDLAPLFAGAR